MKFLLGCNYWASNAGTDMWIDFDEKAIREDLEILRANGVEYLRIFPNWRDFQPVKALSWGHSEFEEYVMADGSAPTNPYFIDEEMMDRFRKFCAISQEYDMKLIVAILTGFMSGMMFVPPILEGRDLFVDPRSLLFEQRFIKGFVEGLKDIKNIIAWELGNECNNMTSRKPLHDYTHCDMTSSWTYVISNAIRAADPTRPVGSGMPSLSPQRKTSNWNTKEHAECMDFMTSHPYTYFHPHCGNDYFTSIRSTMHATVQTRYFADLTGKPAFVEEIGTLGNSMCSDEIAGHFMRVNLYSNWANDNGGLMWWCANEQNELKMPPYSWNMLEVELGMIDRNRQPKTYLLEMKAFSEFLKGLDFDLPKPHYDAVCIVPRGYAPWEDFALAMSTYILAKQAHINLQFCFADDPLPEADTYILPSMKEYRTLKFYALREKIAQGATLYVSSNGAFMQDMAGFTGVEITDTAVFRGNVKFDFKGSALSIPTNRLHKTKALTAEVLAADQNGNVVIAKNTYGKGTVYFVTAPIEAAKVNEFDAFSDGSHKIYAELLKNVKTNHVLQSDNPHLCITHHFAGDECYCVVVNHSEQVQNIDMQLHDGYVFEKAYKGSCQSVEPFAACVLKFKKK